VANAKVKTTTRSYTLSLNAPSDTTDRSPLWHRIFRTHYAICCGAREFGKLLLDLRGGLPTSLAQLGEGIAENDRRQTQRGTRRILALGWLSVEDLDHARNDPHRVQDTAPGSPLDQDLAEKILRKILITKGIKSEEEQSNWISDCLPALTANIRPDAVWVNRAESFAQWQRGTQPGAQPPTPEEAQQILFSLCGESLVTLTLPEQPAAAGQKQPDQETSPDPEEQTDRPPAAPSADDEMDPSNASRGIFGDLFGENAEGKRSRSQGKDNFACAVRDFLCANPTPSADAITEFREKQKPREPNPPGPEKYPPEVSTSGAPTAVAKRYRKLLVCAGLWPKSADEDGSSRNSAKTKFADPKEPQKTEIQINALDLIDACNQAAPADDSGTSPKAGRVFAPAWASNIAEKVASATQMPANAKSLNEFKRLMFALAARRFSQTQSWTRRNEAERHMAAARQDAAVARLREIDPDHKAQDWLRGYEQRRADQSGSNGEFRITRRMIGEAEAVFKAWAGTNSAAERELKTVAVQTTAEKFGDAALYSEIARNTAAEAVWRSGSAPEILDQWVKLRKAQSDQQRTRVPRFCHPNAFRHPTWCEFGESSKPGVWYAWNPKSKPRKPEVGGEGDGTRRLWVLLPDFNSGIGQAVPLRWRSKRLSKDLGEALQPSDAPIPRADRVSIAAAGLNLEGANGVPARYRPSLPFSENTKGWNARLQANRTALLHLESKWDAEAATWRDGGRSLLALKWFTTFSPELAMSEGPGRAIHPKLGWNSEPHSDLNRAQKRGGNAKLILSRLPGLRVLSVDLGHRYAAACAVWETLTTEQMNAACQAKNHTQPAESDMYVHLAHPTERVVKSGRKKGQNLIQTTVYRRIAADTLPDGTPHPAPWGRLDRQFLIKLQGEQRPTRAASKNEADLANALFHRLGLRSDADSENKSRAVDKLMARTVRVATLGLKRHARRAKIAYALDPNTKAIPGMGGSSAAFTPGDEPHIHLLTDALFDWQSLATDAKWDDAHARSLWNHHIATLPGGFHLENPTPRDESAHEPSRQRQRSGDDALRATLKPIAEKLSKADRQEVHAAWKKYWGDSDGQSAIVPKVLQGQRGPEKTTPSASASGWHGKIRWITDWIMGKYLEGCTGHAWKHDVGGLSVSRITTMKSLYQLHKAFAMRATPEKPRGAPEKGESNLGAAQGILTAMESMRQQRVKQLASRIAEAALGAGIERRSDNGRELQRPRERVDDPRFAACHAVVVEDLTNYRPDEMQTRRENRQLMQWASSKVKKYLSEACQLHGLYLRGVPAGYTSRQDSRTGAPGVRCGDIPVEELMAAPRWRRQILTAEKTRRENNTGTARDRYILTLDEKYRLLTAEQRKKTPPARIPVKGGDLFVSADPDSPAASGIQADLNAAANIGLKALIDPDWPGRWWYIPCDATTHKPSPERTRGSAAVDCDVPLGPDSTGTPEDRDAKPKKNQRNSKIAGRGQSAIINLWRDPTHLPIKENPSAWCESKKYWNQVEHNVVKVIESKGQKLTQTAEAATGESASSPPIAPTDVPW